MDGNDDNLAMFFLLFLLTLLVFAQAFILHDEYTFNSHINRIKNDINKNLKEMGKQTKVTRVLFYVEKRNIVVSFRLQTDDKVFRDCTHCILFKEGYYRAVKDSIIKMLLDGTNGEDFNCFGVDSEHPNDLPFLLA